MAGEEDPRDVDHWPVVNADYWDTDNPFSSTAFEVPDDLEPEDWW